MAVTGECHLISDTSDARRPTKRFCKQALDEPGDFFGMGAYGRSSPAPGRAAPAPSNGPSKFGGLEAEDYLRVLVVDTSVINDGINRVDTLQNGRLVITAEDLQKLDSGPIQLMFFREHAKSTKHSSNLGGRILITYRLSREFYLKD